MASTDRHQFIETARLRADLSVQDLWLRYLALGGTGDAFDIDGYLQGMVELESFQEDVLAQAVNEALADFLQSFHVPLTLSLPDGRLPDPLPDVVQRLLGYRPSDLQREDPP